MQQLTPKSLMAAVGISQSYASMILNGHRDPPQPLAIRIFQATGHKLGPIANASDEDIAVLERLQGGAVWPAPRQ